VNFFFWKPAESQLPKSIPGLVRSLLHDILKVCPELVPAVFPNEWNRLRAAGASHAYDRCFEDEDEISRGIERLVRLPSLGDSHRLCFFVDALDELEGTYQQMYRDLIDLIKEWISAASGAIKICVSSREDNVFQDHLPSEHRIRLQDLTREDMVQYPRARLHHIESSLERNRLVKEIVTRSDGIFLWVALVVKSVLQGLEDGRSLQSCEEELAVLPSGLIPLLCHLFLSVPDTQLGRACQVFAMIQAYEKYPTELSLHAILYLQHLEKLPLSTTTTGNEVTTVDQIRNESNALLSWHDEQSFKAQRLVQGYCKGLVEVGKCYSMNSGNLTTSPAGSQSLVFIHRSAAEIFQRPEIRSTMTMQMIGFNVPDAISKLHIIEFVCMDATLIDMNHWSAMYTDIIHMMSEACISSSLLRFLRQLDEILDEKVPSSVSWRARFHLEVNGEDVIRHIRHIPSASFYHSIQDLKSPLLVAALFGIVEYVPWSISLQHATSQRLDHYKLVRYLRLGLRYHLTPDNSSQYQYCFQLLLAEPSVAFNADILTNAILSYSYYVREDSVRGHYSDMMGWLIELFLQNAGGTKIHLVHLWIPTNTDYSDEHGLVGWLL
jgi:hypothetical protein